MQITDEVSEGFSGTHISIHLHRLICSITYWTHICNRAAAVAAAAVSGSFYLSIDTEHPSPTDSSDTQSLHAFPFGTVSPRAFGEFDRVLGALDSAAQDLS